MATLFPDAAFLIEKPVSTAPMEEVQKVRELLRGRVVSVGYMLRYLQGQQDCFSSNLLMFREVCLISQGSKRSSESRQCRLR